MLETLVLAVGKQVAVHAAKAWLSDRQSRSERETELSSLIRTSVPDHFIRRKISRQFEDVGDRIAERITSMLQVEIPNLRENEKQAALDAVVDALAEANLTDELMLGADMRTDELVKVVRAKVPYMARRAGLSEPATVLYDLVLTESCACLVTLVIQLPPFQPRAMVEVLSRLTDVSDDIQLALERLPRATLTAPEGESLDGEFTGRYRAYVSESLDQLELFGIDIRRYRPRISVTVAYLGLTASEDLAPQRKVSRDETEWHPGNTHLPGSQENLSVEFALSESKRILLRGQAGSGKTTLLQWIAVTAARSKFTGPLARWNGKIPFSIRLRSYAEADLPRPQDFLAVNAAPISGLEPRGWSIRQINNGNAILLVDGVDELKLERRIKVRKWLAELLIAFPHLEVVITSRPGAAEPRWLQEEGFKPIFLESMNPGQIMEFIRRWHAAVRDWGKRTGDLPCELSELDAYEAAVLRHLESQRHLRTLAVSPLLCAMLCALNLDRHKQLPPDRMKLYESALELLLERRDFEREIPTAAEFTLSATAKVTVLQHLAWWLTLCARSEASTDEAEHQIASALKRIPDARDFPPTRVLEHLLERSGVVREPADGRIDFVHRTFQEYLAGKYAAEEHYIDVLIKNAHIDQWRETIIMSIGHAAVPVRKEIINSILDRAQHERRHARKLRLLAGAALETARVLENTTLERVESELSTVIPPRRRIEARLLAQVGERIIRHLPPILDGISAGSAAACARTAVYVGGEDAFPLLARYGSDPRSEVQEELINGWSYMPPERYAREVLENAPLQGGEIYITNKVHVPYLHILRHLNGADVFISELPGNDLSFMCGAVKVVDFTVNIGGIVDLSPLGDLINLRMLRFGGHGSFLKRRCSVNAEAA